MGCIGSGWGLSLTGGEAGQRAGLSGSRASAGEVWKQEEDTVRKEGWARAGYCKIKNTSKETEFLVPFPNYIALSKPSLHVSSVFPSVKCVLGIGEDGEEKARLANFSCYFGGSKSFTLTHRRGDVTPRSLQGQNT